MPKQNLPRITVITPSLNQAEFLERAICSVLDQGYENLEYIVMDGGSCDNSAEIIRLYEEDLTFWQSAPDEGPADAINQAIRRATGDIIAVLNADDPLTLRMRDRTSARVLTFGRGEQADIRATDETSQGLDGLGFTLNFEGQSAAVRTPLIGAHHVMTALAAAAVVLGNDWTLAETAEALSTLHAGQRLKPRRSYSGALILDDTYNAAPLSMQAALDLLAELPGNRVAVLGDMLELGGEEEAGHRAVGAYSVGRCDRLIAIGELAKITADAAWDAGHQQIQWFEDKTPATKILRQELGADDVVLIKASHAQELETMVEALITP